MNMRNAFPSTYLKASDLNGKPTTAVMANVVMEKIGNDEKPVLFFDGKKKGLALNRINTSVIVDKHGEDSEVWRGNTLVIFPSRTEFKGEMVDCIRVRFPEEALEEPTAAQDDDEIPF